HYDFKPEAIRKNLERSLHRLGTDFLDIFMIHSNGEDTKIILEQGALDTLKDLKKAGYIRAIGMSTKTVEGGILALQNSDVVMMMYNPVNQEEKPIIDYAHANNKGIFVKKALASGHIQKLPGQDPVKHAMQFILKEPGVTSIILGTINKEHLAH